MLRCDSFMATDYVTYGMSLCCLLTEQKGSAATDNRSHVCSTYWASQTELVFEKYTYTHGYISNTLHERTMLVF